jgi:hypothetical protein
LRVTGLIVPAVAAETVRADKQGLTACRSHNTKSRTSAEVTWSHPTSITVSQRHHLSSA